MSYEELKDYLGIEIESPCKLPRPIIPLNMPSLEDVVSPASSPELESPFEECVVEQFNTHRFSSEVSSGVASDIGSSSREDSPVENTHSERNSGVSFRPDDSCTIMPLSSDGGLLSDETMEDIMEVDTVRSHWVAPYPSMSGSPNKAVHLDRLHQTCPTPFSLPVCEVAPASSHSFCSLSSKGSVKTAMSRTVCPNTSMKSLGDRGRLREPLKSLDNFSFVTLSPTTNNGKMKQSKSMCSISRKNSPSIPML